MKTIGNKMLATEVVEEEDGCRFQIDSLGTKTWFDPDTKQLSRKNGPAYESVNQKLWLCQGEFHRFDGPAIERTPNHNNNPVKEYWEYGKLKRKVYADGSYTEYKNNTTYHCDEKGLLHSMGAAAAIIDTQGNLEYYTHGKLDKIIYADKSSWEIDVNDVELYKNTKGQLHRDNGLPAMIDPDRGDRWFDNGMCIGYAAHGKPMIAITKLD